MSNYFFEERHNGQVQDEGCIAESESARWNDLLY